MSKFTLIAGPCVIESKENAEFIACTLKEIANRLDLDFYFKASFDKANRTSISSYRGPGIEKGLQILSDIKKQYGVRICTDIHEAWQAQKVAEVADIIQIPAFLCRQTDLLVAASKTGKIINVKKAQFLAPWDMRNVVKKIEDSGNKNIMLCERGTTFGYNTLVVDMTSFTEMKKLGYPVVFDATHSVQKPGGKGNSTGGNREYVEPLAKAAVAAGANALFFEVHPDPDNALSDGPNMVRLDDFEALLERVIKVYDSSSPQLNNMDKRLLEARRVFDIEIEGLQKTRDALGDSFLKILDAITTCKGKVVITGIGKPGHIATKLAATFSSLGTPSFYLHPAEAMHGDLGMISKNDIVVAISLSGESDEIIQILPRIKLIGAMCIGITANKNSVLAKEADIVQLLPKFKEACYLGLAPTSSTTAELCYGDALAVVASGIYGFKDVDFGKIHPAGALGKRLILKVEDLMVKGENNPCILYTANLQEAIVEISKKGMGVVSVINENYNLLGIVTDGDLRRLLEKKIDIYSQNVKDIMTDNPYTVQKGTLAISALKLMQEKKITCLPVMENNKIIGTVKMQDIIDVGLSENNYTNARGGGTTV